VRGANAKGRTNSVRAAGGTGHNLVEARGVASEEGAGHSRAGPSPPSFGSRVRCEGPLRLFILASLLAAVLMGYVVPSAATDRFQVMPRCAKGFARLAPFWGVGG
jgi:hypothetical protein